MPELLSDLIERGISLTPPTPDDIYIDRKMEPIPGTCSLGAAYVGVVGLEGLPERIEGRVVMDTVEQQIGYNMDRVEVEAPLPFWMGTGLKPAGEKWTLGGLIVTYFDHHTMTREETVRWLRSIGR